MPATISAEAHLFLSKGRAKISLDYLSRLIQLGADPFRDPLLEGLEGKESLIYASMASATLVLPTRPLRLVAPGLVKGLARLLLACPKPRLRFGRMAQPHRADCHTLVRLIPRWHRPGHHRAHAPCIALTRQAIG